LITNNPTKLHLLWSIEHDNIKTKDLFDLKNVFITGTQATGKTTFLHQLIISLLLKKHPSQLKFVLADIKGIELSIYRTIEKHFLSKLPNKEDAIIKSSKQLLNTLLGLCIEMDNRYDLLREAGVRNIEDYNSKFSGRKLDPEKGHQFLPFIVLIIDDLASYLLNEKTETLFALERLINSGYKTGIYNIISTSQFSGYLIQQNFINLFTQKVIFRLNNKEDYKRFFDTAKIDITFTDGDFLYNEQTSILHGKTMLFDFGSIEKLVDFIGEQRGYPKAFLLPEYVDDKEMEGKDFDLGYKDPLFEDAARLIVASQVGSTSLLQRRMKLGCNRAGRLMDQLEAAGVVGANQGSALRDVLIKTDAELQKYLNSNV
jgi:S-DNA-T family DNA segregation ATPase FtsK/SpoIIIE